MILAGGRGERLGALTSTRPKPMVEINGRPFLEYQIELLRDQGFTRVVLLLGYLADVIQDHFGDGARFGMDISYSVTRPSDLTLTRLHAAESMLDEYFLMLYCDNYWPMRFDRMWEQYVAADVEGLTTIYSNKDSYSRDNVKLRPDGLIELFDPTRTAPGLKGIEISYAILRRGLIEELPHGDMRLEDALYPRLIERQQLLGHVTDHRYYSIGSPNRLPLTEIFLARKPAVIVDRDGVLNRKPAPGEYVRSLDEFEWLPGALDALRELREAGFTIIVASNQAGLARGEVSVDALEAIHDAMRAQARAAGGAIDAIYHCPHDWHAGCECRKPRPGLLFQAQHDFSLDLTRTCFLGDDERDMLAAGAAGAEGRLVTDTESLLTHARRLVRESPPRSLRTSQT